MSNGADTGNASGGRTLEPNADVIGQQLGDEVVLVHLKTNRIFELNRTGARFWSLLQDETDRSRIEEQLQAEFDVSDEELASEIEGLISQLAAEDLVRVSP